ncbi:unnamed protein product [Vitrella brassicaformis CCMP3155]|uniref:Urease n=2 Tax=Vitrella brassicaformis TaxID=1169539 RepID=A0A0G4FHS2_VITBC|nr:unnamed protein product [Vitrella brassicaformis CCMP3155]|eukprot:CEM13015.1 unnamed protein product [Vitrella brassicaformis CCMP3155]
MKLSPKEIDNLLVHNVGFLAQKRLARGIRLNSTEATALIAAQVLEFVREGYRVSELMQKGRELLGFNQVLPGVAALLHDVQVEGTFPDGTKLVTVHDPICREDGDLSLALHGSFLPVPDVAIFVAAKYPGDKYHTAESSPTPGELVPASGELVLNEGRKTVTLTVTSTCDRPIQVGSHYHFIETNPYLRFDRAKALGMRLNIAAGTAVRFEPGQTRQVHLVEIAGNKKVYGGNGLVDGVADPSKIPAVLAKLQQQGFLHQEEPGAQPAPVATIPRSIYAHTYGPTVGDRLRLGDTALVVQVEKDFTVYGDECKFGGGKVLREGMGQMANCSPAKALDCVITNALIIDAKLGIVKADVGLKGGMIVGIGKAGNPDVMQGVDGSMWVGATTEAIAGEGLILTAGALDVHVHFICPQLYQEAIASGITTLLGGGTGPATGTNATTCTAGPKNIKDMILATDEFPMNFAFTGKGNTSLSGDEIAIDLKEQIVGGAVGLKLHEDWGTTPAAIDTCLRAAEAYDVQVTIHTDTLNESGCVEHSIAAFKGRSIHTYHSEGAGGGHAPDIMRVCGEPNVLPSSTNPTRPYTVNTIDEHVDMLCVCHHLDKNLKEDLAFAESRIRAETIQAEDILHDLGAISTMSSDSQAMGRIGEVICRTWQTADKMKKQRGHLPEDKDTGADNYRVRRYIAKYTVNPAITHGMSHVIGSVEVGKLADLCLWKPGYFGTKPEIIIKGGQIAWAQMGMPNASIPTPQPVMQREMFGSFGKAVGSNSLVFVSKACVDSGVTKTWGISKRVEAVKDIRRVKKADMVLNAHCPKIHIDPERFHVTVTDDKGGSELLQCEPASVLPLAQRYFLF